MIMQLETGMVDYVCTDMPTAIAAVAKNDSLVILNFSGTDGHGKILDLFGRKQINLIIYDQIRDAFFMKTVNQFKFFFAFTGRTVDNKNCDICFVQNLITFCGRGAHQVHLHHQYREYQ